MTLFNALIAAQGLSRTPGHSTAFVFRHRDGTYSSSVRHDSRGKLVVTLHEANIVFGDRATPEEVDAIDILTSLQEQPNAKELVDYCLQLTSVDLTSFEGPKYSDFATPYAGKTAHTVMLEDVESMLTENQKRTLREFSKDRTFGGHLIEETEPPNLDEQLAGFVNQKVRIVFTDGTVMPGKLERGDVWPWMLWRDERKGVGFSTAEVVTVTAEPDPAPKAVELTTPSHKDILTAAIGKQVMIQFDGGLMLRGTLGRNSERFWQVTAGSISRPFSVIAIDKIFVEQTA